MFCRKRRWWLATLDDHCSCLMLVCPCSCLVFQAKEMMEQRKAARAALSAQLDAQIAEQKAAITKMETELEASGQVREIKSFSRG